MSQKRNHTRGQIEQGNEDKKLDFVGGAAELETYDTHDARHREQPGIFTWKWVADEYKTVRIVPVLNPILKHSRGALAVYRALVNRVVYRKANHGVTMHDNGISRPGEGLAQCRKNYCAHCIDVVVDGKRNKVRTQKGVYLPIEHDCASVRVYNLQGTLIEVMAI